MPNDDEDQYPIIVILKKTTAEELRESTGVSDWQNAVYEAIRFTLMHDKDSIQEALKE